MKLTLLSKYMEEKNDAGHKAPSDIEKIFKKNFGETKRIVYFNIKYFRSIEEILRSVFFGLANHKNNKCVVVQWPLYTSWPANDVMVCSLASNKIAFVHDLDSLRFFSDSPQKIRKEINQLNKFDVVIAHNKMMSSWLQRNGLLSKVVELNCFDYLNDYNERKLNEKDGNIYSICYAGNLVKAEFIKKLISVARININLYGNMPNYKLPSNVNYLGNYSPNDLCKVLDGDFGLIWDGPEFSTCSGKNGEYTRYNNPHKLSLYIACGIPIIAWSKAAISSFITSNDIGFVVDSLMDIEVIFRKLTFQDYKKMVENTRKIREKVINGMFTIEAINKAINYIEGY